MMRINMKNPILGRFEIGDRVVVKGEFRTEYVHGPLKQDLKVPIEISYKRPRFGIICGATHKCLGVRKGYHYNYNTEIDEQPYLSVEKVVTVWQVKLGLLNKPLNCLSNQIERWFMDNFRIPIRYYSNKV
jgi:hypothetical protein